MKHLWLLLAVCSVQGQIVMKKEAAAPPAGFPSSNLVHYWRLEEGFDTALMYDAVGSVDFSLTGMPGLGVGILGAARDFDRTVPEYGDYSGTIWSSGDFTISAWFKTDNNANTQALISQGFGGSGNYAFRLLYGAGIADFRFSVTTNGAANTDVDTVAAAPTAGVWYHVACGFDDTANEIWIEVNGGTRYTTAFTGAIWTGANNVQLGRMQNVDTTTMDGLLDDVCYFNASLSEADVEAIYASSAGSRYAYAVPTSNLVSYYPLDEASGNATDAHGSNTLTEAGTVGTATGIVGNARSFDGDVGDYLESTTFATGATPAFSFWVKASPVTINHYFFDNDDAAGASGTLYGRLRNNGSAFRASIIYTDSTAGSGFLDGSYVIAADEWVHVLVQVTGSFYELYQNGVRVETDAVTGGLASATGFMLGRRSLNASENIEGEVDEVAVYSSSLDPGQIAELYGSGTPPAY